MRSVSPRFAVTATFFLHAAVFTNWVPRIPAVQEGLGLSAGELALAFLGVAAGPLVAIPLAGGAAARFGSRPVTRLALVAYCAALVLPALAPSLGALFVALFFLSATNGGLAVAMNTQGVTVQDKYDRAMFSSFHAANSFGGLAGAGLGGLAAAVGVSPAVHLATAGGVFALVGAVLSRDLLPASADRADCTRRDGGPEGGERAKRAPLFAVPSRSLLRLGALALCVFLAESAVTNWSAVYLNSALGTGQGLAAAGFVVFAFAMAVSRLFGDRLTDAWGSVKLTRGSTLVAAAGLGIGVLADHPAAAITGLAFFGAGLAAAIPVAMKAAGEHPDQPGAMGIAAVPTIGYFGFLAGPSLFGFVAELVSLPGAFGGLALLAVLAAGLAGNAAPAARAEPGSLPEPPSGPHPPEY